MSTNRFYGLVFALHLSIILLDLGFNTASEFFYHQNQTQLLLFILQDTLQVMGIIVLAIMLSSTFVFQAGLIGLLLRKFAGTFLVALLYLAMSILLHATSLRERWDAKPPFEWPIHLIVFFVLQRLVAVLHYHLYKRTIMLLSHPRYHYDSEWIRGKIRKWT